MNKILRMRIPTMLGLVILILGLGGTTLLTQARTSFEGFAAEGEEPQHVKITNVTDSSLTISYQTAKPVLGSISYGTTQEVGTPALDDKDQENGKIQPSRLHYITLSGLTPDTEYFFSIISGDSTFSENGTPYRVRTAPPLTDTPPPLPQFKGSIARPELLPVSEVVVYLTSESGHELSTRVKQNGSYILSLANYRSKDLKSYALLSKDDHLQLTFVSPLESSKVLIRVDQTSPLPKITLSKNYDFTEVSEE